MALTKVVVSAPELEEVFQTLEEHDLLGCTVEGFPGKLGEVYFAGDVNRWLNSSYGNFVPEKKWQLERTGPGTWEGEFELPPGRHEYKAVLHSGWADTGQAAGKWQQGPNRELWVKPQ